VKQQHTTEFASLDAVHELNTPSVSEGHKGQVTPASGARRMTLNMGPQHPSTHGVLRIVLELDGETIITAIPDIGFLHTGIEKECEVKTWQQAVTLTDRVDYLANLSNNLVYALAVEKLIGDIEIPPKAQWMRVMLTEFSRLNSHLVWLGTHALDIGAMTVFFYCFREREDILRIFEMFSGQRMMTSYIRIGGLALEPPRGWQDRVGRFINAFPSKVDEYCWMPIPSGSAARKASASARSTIFSTSASPGR
jgi:NADH-quinone oxidoreductase subunit D